jgi:hypothetical protein
MPRNNTGDTILASEWNEIADQVDINTGNISTHTTTLATHAGLIAGHTTAIDDIETAQAAFQGPKIKGSKASAAALTTVVAPVLGDAWIAEDTGNAWIYTASVSVGAIAGFINLGPVAVDVLPLPLYTLTGYSAVLPPGETPIANFANMTALTIAVQPLAQGERIQIANGANVRVYESVWSDSAWSWQTTSYWG